MKAILEAARRGASLVIFVIFFGAMFVGCGAVHQLMSISECSPGKPEMSLTAFVLAGIGGSVCITPKSEK
jgi:hypothetical protein